MLTKEQEPTEPWGAVVEPVDSVSRNLPKVVFVLQLLFICFCEAIVIRGAWFKQGPSSSNERVILAPFFALFPGFVGIAMWFVIGKLSKVGQISLSAGSTLKNGLGGLLSITYMCLVLLAFG